jgi:hypothetical protein
MDDRGKSDGLVVPAKLPNKPAVVGAEVVEGRGPAEGNAASKTRAGRRAGLDASGALERVRRRAKQDTGARFRALLHHVDAERLGAAYAGVNPRAATGTDGVTWEAYGRDLEANLQGLLGRLHRGGYRAKPARRAWIPKADGRQRPLGIAALEDKLLQRAVVEVLNGIYEADFLGFSYGFRPGRSAHDALDALAAGIYGTAQGASASPLLANVYLHYVFDLWAHQWRRREASGEVIIVRYADDYIVGFQHQRDAQRFWSSCARGSRASAWNWRLRKRG